MSGSQSAVFTRLRDSDRESWRPRSRAFSRKFLSKYIPNAGLFCCEILQPVLRQTFNSRYVSNKVIVFINNLQINIWDFFNYVSCSTWCSNDASNSSTGLHDSWKYSVDSAKFDKGKTLAGMWGHYDEASLEDSCLVPAASRGWAGHSVELQQPTMPEQERRSHGFEVTAIHLGLNHIWSHLKVILEEARTQRRPKSAPQPQSRKMASVEERLKVWKPLEWTFTTSMIH